MLRFSVNFATPYDPRRMFKQAASEASIVDKAGGARGMQIPAQFYGFQVSDLTPQFLSYTVKKMRESGETF